MKHYSLLMVDDDVEFLEEFGPILSEHGFDVHTATNGSDALQIAGKVQPAVVLMDERLPDADGQELIKNIRGVSKKSSFIMITAYADVPSVVKGLREGISDYITKPTEPNTLLHQIFKVMQHRRHSDADKEKMSQLAKKNEELKRLDNLKSQFVANVSHELLGPLGIIKESIDIAREKCSQSSGDDAHRYFDISERELGRLIRFTKNMLDLSKIESGKMPFQRAEVDMVSLAADVTTMFESECDKNDVELELHADNVPSSLYLDPDLMRELLVNLISNGIKHSKQGQKVKVGMFADEAHFRIEVTDEGPGIPEKLRPNIFDKYYRIFEDRTQGTGLGLSIVKEIVSLHGGKVWVEPAGETGSNFVVYLPILPIVNNKEADHEKNNNS